jgi:hypothetical protein
MDLRTNLGVLWILLAGFHWITLIGRTPLPVLLDIRTRFPTIFVFSTVVSFDSVFKGADIVLIMASESGRQWAALPAIWGPRSPTMGNQLSQGVIAALLSSTSIIWLDTPIAIFGTRMVFFFAYIRFLKHLVI